MMDVSVTNQASRRYLARLQSLKLDGNGCVGFQKLQQFIIGPFQAVLLWQETKERDDPNNRAAGLQDYASRKLLLKGQEKCLQLAFLELARTLLDRAPEHSGAAQEGLQGVCLNPPRPSQGKNLFDGVIVKNGNLFRADQIGDDFPNTIKYVAPFNALNEPRARGIEPHEEKMIPLHLFAQGELLHSQAQLFCPRGHRRVTIRGLSPATGLGRRHVSIPSPYHIFLSQLLSH